MTGTIGKFFFQFGVTVGVAVFLSLLCALTLTPMLCAFFLNLHEKRPRRPLPFGLSLAAFVGGLVLLVGTSLRLASWWFSELAPWCWPLRDLAGWVAGTCQLAWQPDHVPAAAWWTLESLVEFLVPALVTRYGNVLYWAVDRFLLGPLLLRPTEWLLDRMTTGYGWLLAWSL